MHSRPLFSTLAFTTSVLFLVGAEPYRDPARHFSLTVPDGWVEITPEVVRGISALAKLQGQANQPPYVAGFQPKDQALGEGPYVLVHVSEGRLSGYRYDQIENFARDSWKSQSQKAGGVFVRPANFNCRVDRELNRIVFDLQLKVVGLIAVQGRSFGMLGANQIVYLHCYAPKTEFGDNLPIFETLADSLHFDPGHQFVASADSTAFFRPGFRDDVAIMAAVAVFIGAIYGLRAFARRIRRPPAAAG